MANLITIGIDPSYTKTGLALLSGTSVIGASFCSAPSEYRPVGVQKAMYQLEFAIPSARSIAYGIKAYMDRCQSYALYHDLTISAAVIEYPVLATRSGAYLGLIQQAFYDVLQIFPQPFPVYAVPSMAISSFTKAKLKTKTELVQHCKSLYKTPKALDHDRWSAVVLAHIGQQIVTQTYKHSFKVYWPPIV